MLATTRVNRQRFPGDYCVSVPHCSRTSPCTTLALQYNIRFTQCILTNVSQTAHKISFNHFTIQFTRHQIKLPNMTIRVEREALLMVINTSFPSSSSCSQYINDEDEFVIVDSVPTKPLKSNDFFYSDLIPSSTEDDDLGSLCTLSTTSSVSSYDSSSDISTVDRRVSFASQIVTDVWTRERTLPEDVSNLYYSSLETQTVGTVVFRSYKRISYVELSTSYFRVLFLEY